MQLRENTTYSQLSALFTFHFDNYGAFVAGKCMMIMNAFIRFHFEQLR